MCKDLLTSFRLHLKLNKATCLKESGKMIFFEWKYLWCLGYKLDLLLSLLPQQYMLLVLFNFFQSHKVVQKRIVNCVFSISLGCLKHIKDTLFCKILTLTLQFKVKLQTILLGTSDPYCEVSMGSQEHKTKVIPKDLNPKWNSTVN